MPGTAVLFQVLDLVVDRMAGDPQLARFASVMKANSGHAHFGALGPSIADFFPESPPRSTYRLVWQLVFHALSGDPNGTPRPGLFSTLISLKAILKKVQKIADDEDLVALLGIVTSGEVNDIKRSADDLKTAVKGVIDDAKGIAVEIAMNLKPEVNTAAKTDTVPKPKAWRTRDFLHWKKTGLFVRKLLDKAEETSDPDLRSRLQAYAWGYLVSYACKVCGSPFVNSIVGGPFRTQWWRQRFVRNYIDAWVYGFYQLPVRPTIGPDDKPAPPAPPYDKWPGLCGANLQKKLNFGPDDPHDPADLLRIIGQQADDPPQLIPDNFAGKWLEAFFETYGSPDDVPGGFSPNALNLAYRNIWLMLWVQTSGDVLECDPGDIKPPDTCGKDSDELTPFKKDEQGNPMPPPDAQFDDDVDVKTVICGIVLAILGGVFALAASLAAGAAAVVNGIEIAKGGVDWPKLRCQLYWYRMYLFNAIVGMKRLLATTGFGYPDPDVFEQDEQALDLLGTSKPLESAPNLVKSRLKESFPSKVWFTVDPGDQTSPPDLAFLNKVFTKFEKPPDASDPGFEVNVPNDPIGRSTVAYESEAYPLFFIDDPGNPLTNGDVKTGGGFPFRSIPIGPARIPLPFGNAVDNAVDLFRHIDQQFPDWNLDGDRGMAWFTWQFKDFYDPDAVQYEKEP